MATVIRRGTRDDVESLLDIREAVAAEGIWIAAEAPIDRDGDRVKFATTIADQDDGTSCVMLVAEVDGVLVGNLSMHNQRGLAHLGMAIADGFREQGVGARLMDAAIEWARGAGVYKIALDHWAWNLRARRLYERCGFVEEGYLRRHYRRRNGALWDMVSMGLVLDHESPGHEVRADRPPS